jgi:hypothetical protein
MEDGDHVSILCFVRANEDSGQQHLKQFKNMLHVMVEMILPFTLNMLI